MRLAYVEPRRPDLERPAQRSALVFGAAKPERDYEEENKHKRADDISRDMGIVGDPA
jgi:hypothetical protein